MATLYAAVVDLPIPEARERALEASPPLPRLPAFERLVARGHRARADADWRRWALGCAGLGAAPGDLPVGEVLARAGGLGLAAADTYLAVAPLRLGAGLAAVRVEALPAALGRAAAERLASRFNAEWAGEACELFALDTGLVLRHRGRLGITTLDPALSVGRDLAAALPRGADAARLVRLMTEIQMWLHALPPADGAGHANALWLWGGGHGELAGAARWPAFADIDPFLAAARALYAGEALAGARLARWPVAELAAGEGLAGAERAWFGPLAAALKSGALAAAELHVGDTTIALTARQRFRVWRRPRPWWELGA